MSSSLQWNSPVGSQWPLPSDSRTCPYLRKMKSEGKETDERMVSRRDEGVPKYREMFPFGNDSMPYVLEHPPPKKKWNHPVPFHPMCTKHYLNIVRGHSSPFALLISTSEEMVNGTWDMTIAPSSELMITSFRVDLTVGWWGQALLPLPWQ